MQAFWIASSIILFLLFICGIAMLISTGSYIAENDREKQKSIFAEEPKLHFESCSRWEENMIVGRLLKEDRRRARRRRYI